MALMPKEPLAPIQAPDGVQEAPMTDARALLTRLVDDASIDGKVSAFTTRGRRRAYVVPPAVYEELLRLRQDTAQQG